MAAHDLSRRAFVIAGGAAGVAATIAGHPAFGAAVDVAGSDPGGRCEWDGRAVGTPAVDRAVRELVVANRFLAKENVTDAYGHVSVRHPERPDRFLISTSRSPALVSPSDIMELNLDGTAAGADRRPMYAERFIHGEIFRARPDINAVVHAHLTEILPFTVGSVPLRVVTHSAGVIGETIPVWDIRTKFGDTNMLVDDVAKGRDLATALGANNVVLMRGHGFAGAGRDLIEMIRIALYLKVDAEVLLEALRLGQVTYLSPGEIQRIREVGSGRSGLDRAWEYWAHEAGCSDLLKRR